MNAKFRECKLCECDCQIFDGTWVKMLEHGSLFAMNWLKSKSMKLLFSYKHEVFTGLKWINQFSTNVPLTDKPGDWFLLAKYLKNTCGRVTF